MWPKQWSSCTHVLEWRTVALNQGCRSKVPTSAGIYSLVVNPEIAGHPGCSYLMYVGKATDLRRRFGEYLTTERTRRPKIVRLLEMYTGHIAFYYSRVALDALGPAEEQLINGFIRVEWWTTWSPPAIRRSQSARGTHRSGPVVSGPPSPLAVQARGRARSQPLARLQPPGRVQQPDQAVVAQRTYARMTCWTGTTC